MVVLCRVQRRSRFLELVHQDVSPRGHAHRDVQRLNVHLRLYRHVSLHGAFPIPREGFHGVEGRLRLGFRRGSLGRFHLMRVRLRESHGGERHQNNRQHSTNGFHVSFSLSFFTFGSGLPSHIQSASNHLGSTTSVIVNYNTIEVVKRFFCFLSCRSR